MKTRKRVLITGSTGFVGRALCSYLSETKTEEIDLIKSSRSSGHGRDVVECDCRKPGDVNRLIADVKPHEVYNLIGSYSKGYDDEYEANVLCTKNIFDAIVAHPAQPARVLTISSVSAVGVIKPADLPVREDAMLLPVSTYGLTKATQALLAGSYARMYGLNVVLARTFNIVGIGISCDLFVGKLVAQISSYLRGEIREITVGNLRNKRDYLDIRDVVTAYHRIMQRAERGGVYNVGSGTSISTRNLLDMFIKVFGIPRQAINQLPSKNNEFDVRDSRSDNTKLRALGWKQSISIEQSIDDIRKAIQIREPDIP